MYGLGAGLKTGAYRGLLIRVAPSCIAERWRRKRPPQKAASTNAIAATEKEKGGFGPPFGTTEKLLRLWPNCWPGLRNHLEDSPLSPWYKTTSMTHPNLG